jgi:hypothetical protein
VLRRRKHRAVRFVHHDEIRELDDALLHALKLVAASWRDEEDEHVGEVVDVDFGLTNANGLDDDYIESRLLAQERRFVRPRRDAAQRATVRRRANVCVRIVRQLFHACLVAEDRATSADGRGINREHCEAMALRNHVRAERLDQCRLPRARWTRDSDPHCPRSRRAASVAAPTLRDVLQDEVGLLAVVRTRRFRQRDEPR